jgi:phosphatidate cytidylyltransferase
MTEWPEGVRWVFAGILSLLVVASVVVAAKVFTQGRERHRELVLRMISWWWMVAIIAVVFMLGRIAATVFFALLSFLALKEYLSLVPTRRADRAVLFWVYLTIPVQYLWVAQGWYHMFIIFIAGVSHFSAYRW